MRLYGICPACASSNSSVPQEQGALPTRNSAMFSPLGMRLKPPSGRLHSSARCQRLEFPAPPPGPALGRRLGLLAKLLAMARLSAGHGSVPGTNLGRDFLAGEPGGGYVLGFGVENESIASHAMQVAKERLLVPSEAEDTERNRDADVNAYHAGIGPLRELACEVAAFGVDHGAIGEAALVHDLQPFFEGVHALDAEHRTEDLFPATQHF